MSNGWVMVCPDENSVADLFSVAEIHRAEKLDINEAVSGVHIMTRIKASTILRFCDDREDL